MSINPYVAVYNWANVKLRMATRWPCLKWCGCQVVGIWDCASPVCCIND